MNEAERRARRIKLNQELSKLSMEEKKFDQERLDLSREMHRAEEEVPRLKSELALAKARAEQKKRELDQKANSATAGRVSAQPRFGVSLAKPPQSGFELMAAKAQADREYGQKERDVERTSIELKAKLNELKRRSFQIERQHAELGTAKQTVVRELEAIKKDEDLEKRKRFGQRTKPELHDTALDTKHIFSE